MEQKLHTPEGVRDIYNRECEKKLSLQKKLSTVLHQYGYQDIQTPTFEYYDVFREEIGSTSTRELYKFFDRDGNILSLRPDITPSIARAAATLFEDEDFPIRICYAGNTFINHSSYQGRLKENTQLGAELIGDDSIEADAEMLAMVVDGLKKIGLKEFQINIGHVDFIHSLLESTGLEEEEKEEIRTLVDIGGESREYSFGESFTPIADENTEFITLIFRTGGAVLERDIPVVMGFDEEDFIVENMFVGEGYDTQKSDGGLTMTARQAGNFSWIYANAVAAEGASLSIAGLAGKSAPEALKVVFTDYADAKISVTMYVENAANGNLRVLFGNTDRELSKSLSSGGAFVFSYASGMFYVDSVGVTVSADDSGKPFNGFPSGRVYISAEAIGATAGAGYTVQKLDNMSITNLPRDRIKPRIAISGVYGGMYAKDSVYVIAPAIASDTVDPNVSFSMTVKSPLGEVMTDINGKLLSGVDPTAEYRILLSEYGQYKVEYTAVDFSGNQTSTSYAVNIMDMTAPVVTVADTWSSKASVGEKVTLPEVTVSDDKSAMEDIMVYRTVRNPNGVLVVFGFDYTVGEDGQLDYTRYNFTYKYAGIYRFIVLAMDEAGNQTIVQYFVTVS